MIAAPYTEAAHISHTYTDRSSTIKFIERNWNLGTISDRSGDNLPNPKPGTGSEYIPANSPAMAAFSTCFHLATTGNPMNTKTPGLSEPARRSIAAWVCG